MANNENQNEKIPQKLAHGIPKPPPIGAPPEETRQWVESLDDKGKDLLREWIEGLSDDDLAQMLP